jgi:hypothetical protein
MATVKIFLKNSLSSLTSLVTEYSGTKIKKLLEFTTSKSKEYGIIPSSSTVVADIRVNSTNARKFFKKIYTSLYGQVLKKVPYMDFMEKAEIELHYNRFHLDLPLLKVVKSIPHSDLVEYGYISDKNSSYINLSFESVSSFLEDTDDTCDFPTVKRYARYINHKCAINGCPLRIKTFRRTDIFGDIPTTTTENIQILFTIRLTLELGSWYKSDGNRYEFNSAENQINTYSSHPECSSFNLFTFFDDIPKVIKTLSRKGHYNANAYVV